MSTQVLPAMPGLTFPWTRTPKFKTRRPESVSGKETRIADWQFPRYTWTLPYSFLRQGVIQGTWAEYTQLRGFFEQMLGGYDSFLYDDPDDDNVSAQGLGLGNGSQNSFQLIRAQGGFVEPIYAPNLTLPYAVFLDGVQQGSGFSITSWGASPPGVLVFSSPPGSGVLVSISYSYYWPVRFDDDTMTFNKFMSNLYELKKMNFTSIK